VYKDNNMPIYEYQCEKCHHHLEALQKMSDKPLRECPECGKHTLKRLLSAPMFRLAGSGWYETDFKSDKENRRNLAGKDEAPSSSETKSEAGADAKPAAPQTAADKPASAARPVARTKPPAKKTLAKRPSVKKPSAKKAARKR